MHLDSVGSAPPVILTAVRKLVQTPDATRTSSLPLKHVCNRTDAGTSSVSTSSRPTPLRVMRFANSKAANTPRSEDDPDNAQVVLAEQIHALLNKLADGAPPRLGQAIASLDFHRDGPLDQTTLQQIVDMVSERACTRHASPHQQLMLQALRDLARAADADLQMRIQVERHSKRQAPNNTPGAHCESMRGIGLGAALGLPGTGEASLTGAVHRTTSTSTYDDLAVAHFRTTTVSARAGAEVGLPAGVGVGAHASVQVTRGPGEVDDKMQDRVLALARASVARRMGGPRLLRMAKRLVGPRRDRYAERISTALAWQTRLPQLLGHSTPLRTPRFHPEPPPPIAATLHTVGGEIGAHAGVGVLDLNLSAGASRTEVQIDLPMRVTDSCVESRALRQDLMLQRRLDERVAPLLDRAPASQSRTLQLAQRIRCPPSGADIWGMRLAAMEHLEVEFHHLEALVRHTLAAPRQATPPLASLARDWGSDNARCEAVMVRMLDLLAWLQATAEPAPDTPAHAQWERLQQHAQTVADRIHESRIPHDRKQVHQATHAFRPMTQRIASHQAQLGLTPQFGVPGVGASARASVAHLERDDPDPLRAGTYVDVTLTGEFSPSVGELLAEVQRHLPGGWNTLPTQQVEHVLTHLSPSFPTTLNVRCVIRLFRPRFQQEPGFPAWAKGLHLQAVRVSAGSTQGVNLVAPVPLAPGLSLKPGLHYQRTEQVPQMEWLYEGTLTGPLLRYISLRTRDTDEATTWATMLERHGADVDRLAAALAKPGSVAAGEARYWLNRDVGNAGPTPAQREAIALLRALEHSPDKQARRTQMHRLMQALAEVTQRAKRASPFIGPAALPRSPLR